MSRDGLAISALISTDIWIGRTATRGHSSPPVDTSRSYLISSVMVMNMTNCDYDLVWKVRVLIIKRTNANACDRDND